jgi:aryl-alcohol dehydrogenase-like predicted oxidoreductase
MAMESRRLGATGVDVTRVILGCGNFGGVGSAPAFFGQGESEEEAFALMDAAWESGVRAFDTADAYGGGRSETWIGRWLAARGHRPVLATKVFNSVTGDPSDRGLARERILRQIEGSLERLGVERVDLYLIHAPDPDTPLAETLGAFDELVRAGQVGAIGASNVDRPYLEEALAISEREGIVRFEWVQNSYSLLDREPERGVLAFCREHGLGFTPFSPLAGGWLTGKYRRGRPYPVGSRMTQRPEPYRELENERIYRGLELLAAAAADCGVETSTLALAWLFSDPAVTAIVVGPRRPEHLKPALRALELDLTPAERDDLAAFFEPS